MFSILSWPPQLINLPGGRRWEGVGHDNKNQKVSVTAKTCDRCVGGLFCYYVTAQTDCQ